MLDPWAVFGIGWAANAGAATAVYWLARRYGRPFFAGRIGRRLLPEGVLAHIAAQYHRHGTYGIFLLALASALWYGALTFLVTTLGANFDEVVRVLHRVNAVLAVVAAVAVGVAALTIRRRLRR